MNEWCFSGAEAIKAAPRRRPGTLRCRSEVTAETQKATIRIGTRGSPLALAQAYATRDKLKVLLTCLCACFQNHDWH